MSYITNIFRLDAQNIIIHIRHGNLENTNTVNIQWNSIRSISVDENRILIYHGHQQSIFSIDGLVAVPLEEVE